MSVASCAQVETDRIVQDTLPATKIATVSPTNVPADEMDVPAPDNSTTEPADSSSEAATSTATLEPTATLAPTIPPETSVQNQQEEEPPMTTQSLNQGTEKLVGLATADLAQRLNITPEEIEVVEVQAVTWGDTSMGCPQPDMRYKQIPQDGLLIKLRVDGQVYEYHSGGSREPFLCEQTIRVKPTTPKLDEFVPSPGADK